MWYFTSFVRALHIIFYRGKYAHGGLLDLLNCIEIWINLLILQTSYKCVSSDIWIYITSCSAPYYTSVTTVWMRTKRKKVYVITQSIILKWVIFKIMKNNTWTGIFVETDTTSEKLAYTHHIHNFKF